MSLVYMATCRVNGKRYIGYTDQTFKKRITTHLSCARKGVKMVFLAAIRKHGEGNFHWEIIKDNLSIDEAWQLEARLIEELKPEYNVGRGGKNPLHGIPWTEARKKLLSASKTGKKHSAEAVANIRDAIGRPVICDNDGNWYPCVAEAAKAYGISKCYFGTICKSTRPTTDGLRFYYEDEGGVKELDLEEEARIKERSRSQLLLGHGLNRRKVICLDDGDVYESATAAGEHYGLIVSNVTCVCVGKVYSTGGKHFAYYSEGFSEEDRQSLLRKAKEKQKSASKASKAARSIVCTNDDRKFRTVTEAAKAYGIHRTLVSYHCRNGTQTKDGLGFVYA